MHPAHPLLSPAMSPLAALRWGVVGCGDVCAHKSGPALAQPRSSVHAVARRTPGAAAAYAAEHGIPAAYEASSALLADPACNAVYIATPPDSHAALAVAAAAAGKPTLLEKPMARCAAEAAAVAAVFERAGVPLFVAYYRRCLPRYVRVRELLPRVGEVTGVRAEVRFKPEAGGVCGGGGGWRFERDVGGGGLFVDVGSHVLDLLDFLLGPVRVECSEFGDAHTSSWVAADADAYSGVEDRMVAAVSFALAPAAGADNLLAFDFRGAPAGADRVTITGAEGELSFPALGLYDSGASVTLTDAAGAVVCDESIPNPAFVHAPLVATIVRELVGGVAGACPCTAASGVRAAIAVDAALEWGSARAVLRQKGFADGAAGAAEAAVRRALAAQTADDLGG